MLVVFFIESDDWSNLQKYEKKPNTDLVIFNFGLCSTFSWRVFASVGPFLGVLQQ